MFLNFFHALKQKGLVISLSEWLMFQDALNQGLVKANLDDLYYVSRMILIKKESDYDQFDLAFEETFYQIKSDDIYTKQLQKWLDTSEITELNQEDMKHYMNLMEEGKQDQEQVKEEFLKRLQEQDREHNGGNHWIGTMGKTSFGNSGANLGGIRIGGKTGHQSAFQVIGEKKYRDFRDDRVMDHRQFQQAFRKLRQFSTRLDIPKTELDIDQTVSATCNQGGFLKIVMEKPRKNSVKVLLLMDSGGTMIPYTSLINDLFQSVNKSNHLKDVKSYYFHNCIYSKVYKTPECKNGDWVDTEWLFRTYDQDYKVIIVGDAAMAPEELYAKDGNYRGPNDGMSGLEWLLLLKKQYRKIVWLNPKMAPGEAPWREAETEIKKLFPMFKLTVKGLHMGMDILMNSKTKK